METAYDNTENNVCEIETSHFKTYDSNHEYTNPEVAKDSFLEDEHKVANSMDLLKSNINSDFKTDQTTSDLLETKHRFDDDFGPETDVDAVDDANVAKNPNMLLEDNAFSADLSNGVKPFSLENKIIEFLTNTNPFSDDQFDECNNQHQTVKDELMDATAVEKCGIDGELVVDNKIIDALESLGITNGEKQTHDDEDKPLDSGLVNDSSAELAGYTEKVDNSHEKYYTEMQNEDPFDNNVSIVCDNEAEEEPAYGVNLNCAATSAGEESDEEEDEWNYIQGDKKQDQQLAEQSEPEPAPSVGEPAEVEIKTASDQQQEDPAPAVDLEFVAGEETAKNQQLLDEPLAELADPTPSDTDAFAAVVGEPAIETAIDETESREAEAAADLCKDEEALIDPVPAVTSPAIPTEQEYKHQEQEKQEKSEDQETEQHESAEYVPSVVPVTELQQPEEIEEETISQPNDLVPLEQEPTLEKDVTEALSKETLQEEVAQLEDSPKAAAGEEEEEEVERPNSLSFDMASKLNPEAKEFVPTGSPTQSNPTSPVANMPEMPQNSFLLLGDDVVAQSPKKGLATMDNIDVPAEDDFQQEMNKCPHELEQFPEHTNGTANGDETIGSHSPISEPSYQELNLKEAMQCDEKLDNEYSDVQQNDDTTDNHHPSELNLLAKEQNPMSMSFYAGRDEALIISNSDELNKVQPLPSDDESSELVNGQSVEEAMTTNDEEETRPVEEEAPIQQEEHLVSFENPVESVNEEKHAEQLPESIFSAASQVVDDVTALVGQMQLEIPTAPQQEEIANPFELDEKFSKPPVETEHLLNAANETESLVSFEQDTGFENHVQEEVAVDEIATDLDVGQSALQQEAAELSQPLSAAETEELVSPVVEVSQQEITTENEFITDENVLDVVPSPVPAGHEAPISPVPMATQHEEPVEEELCVFEKEATVEQVPQVTSIDLSTEQPVAAEPVPNIVNEEPIIEEVKPVVDETAAEKTTITSEEVPVTMPKTPEPVVSSVAKTAKATVGAAKKAPAAAKPSITKLAAKPTTAAKTSIVPAAKKTPATSGPTAAARTSTVGAAKSPKVGAVSTRTSAVGTVDKKPAATTDKKLVNGDAKTTLVQKRTITSTSANATAKTTTTTTAARPSSATAKSLTATKPPAARPAAPAKAPTSAKASTTTRAPVSATPRPTTGPAKTGSATTARTSTGLPTTKPRVAPTTASKPVGATTASKTTVSATKRISSVQTATQKTATSSTTTTAAATKSSSTTSRTSVVSKTSSTTSSAGLVRKTQAAPARKPITSPSAAKTGSKTAALAPGGKPAPIRKATAVKEPAVSNNDTTQDLLDLDKQLKNDNNQLITKNGIETQMIVIDSAAD